MSGSSGGSLPFYPQIDRISQGVPANKSAVHVLVLAWTGMNWSPTKVTISIKRAWTSTGCSRKTVASRRASVSVILYIIDI